MNKLKLALAVLALALPLAGPEAFTARAQAEPPGQIGPGYVATPNVEYIKTMPLDTDAAGGRVYGHYFYVTSSRYLDIYDVKDPLNPTLVGNLVLPQQPQFAEEDVDTNGNILLVGTFGTLYVIDVEDKTNPQIIGRLSGADQHTVSCLYNCTWAYGSEGAIVDLRNPRKPKLVGDWSKGTPAKSFHDVTEVKPGWVVTSTQPIMLLNTHDPARPKVVAQAGNADGRFIHANLWPDEMRDRYLLVGGETEGPCSDPGGGQFMTWDTRGWRHTHTFHMVDQFGEGNGDYLDGQAPANTFCAHWFRPNPTYHGHGLVAMAWYEHGTRFLRVSPTGHISEVGYFTPAGTTEASSPYWLTKRILYVVDYNRGVDILKYTGALP